MTSASGGRPAEPRRARPARFEHAWWPDLALFLLVACGGSGILLAALNPDLGGGFVALGGAAVAGAAAGLLAALGVSRRATARADTHTVEMAALAQRLQKLEATAGEPRSSEAEVVTELAHDVAVLGRLVSGLAESAVAAREREAAAPRRRLAVEALVRPRSGDEPAPSSVSVDGAGAIAEAITAGRLELLTRPVVDLPQRRLRFLAVTAGLRLRDGTALGPEIAMAEADRLGLRPAFDRALAEAALALTGEDAPVAVAASVAALADPDWLRAVEGGAPIDRLIVRLPSVALGAWEGRAAAVRLGQLGVRLMTDGSGLASADRDLLRDCGVTYAGAAAAGLLAAGHGPDGPDEGGPTLVATEVDRETDIPDLIEFGAGFAEGDAIGPWRPAPDVRAPAAGLAQEALRRAG